MSKTVRDIAPNDFINQLALNIKNQGKIQFPEKFLYCKTGLGRQFAPLNPDWYYVRAAAILRRLYLQSPLGLTDLKRMFGKELDGTAQGCHHKPASGAIILKNKYVEKTERGRKITMEGIKLLEETANSMK